MIQDMRSPERWLRSRSQPDRPPGPRGHALLGSILDIRRNPLRAPEQWRRDYGDTVYFRLLSIVNLIPSITLRPAGGIKSGWNHARRRFDNIVFQRP